ncbi:MAG: hypothetical protein IT174_10615 [Acidobacteria bacterium]|nr:hypothetical protein [Acidobacteriota bacterium]
MTDWTTVLSLFAGFFLSGSMVGLAVGFGMGQRHILASVQRRIDHERTNYLRQVKQRADTRLANASAAAVARRNTYGILEETDLS